MENNLVFFLGGFLIFSCLTFFGYLLSVLYKRATNGLAFVRTGYGGELIVQNRGAFVFPILHRVVPVNLQTICLYIQAVEEAALLSKDCLKIDIKINFYVSVPAEPAQIANAAQTLGIRTMDQEELHELLAGKLIAALREVAASMTLTEIHQQRTSFTQQIQQILSEELLKNSLCLESVSLISLEQTARENFQENDLFDAEGLTRLTEITESECKARHQIEQQTRLEMKRREFDTDKQIIEMEKQKKLLLMEHERDLKKLEAVHALQISTELAEKSSEEERAKLQLDQEMALLRQEQKIILFNKSKDQYDAQIESDRVRAEVVKAEERVTSARELEIAERQSQIDLMNAKLKAEHEASMITEIARANKNAAKEYAEAERIKAFGEAEKYRILQESKASSENIITESENSRYQREAEGIKLLIDAFEKIGKTDIPHSQHKEVIEIITGLIKVSDDYRYQSNSPGSQSTDQKSGQYNNLQQKANKLQSLLEDAHDSLIQEALNTVEELNPPENDIHLIDQN